MVPVAVVQGGATVELEALRARVLHDHQRVVVQPVPGAHQLVQVGHQPRVRQDVAERLTVRLVPSQEPRQVLAPSFTAWQLFPATSSNAS